MYDTFLNTKSVEEIKLPSSAVIIEKTDKLTARQLENENPFQEPIKTEKKSTKKSK